MPTSGSSTCHPTPRPCTSRPTEPRPRRVDLRHAALVGKSNDPDDFASITHSIAGFHSLLNGEGDRHDASQHSSLVPRLLAR